MNLSVIPQEQLDRVFSQDECDICPEFMGFTDIYEALAGVIPRHWTIVDLGCAYAPQAFIFCRHKAYVGVDLLPKAARFLTPNSTIYEMSIEEFVQTRLAEFDQETTFAICSYVPPWGGDNMKRARENFKNVFTYYPAGGPEPRVCSPSHTNNQ